MTTTRSDRSEVSGKMTAIGFAWIYEETDGTFTIEQRDMHDRHYRSTTGIRSLGDAYDIYSRIS